MKRGLRFHLEISKFEARAARSCHQLQRLLEPAGDFDLLDLGEIKMFYGRSILYVFGAILPGGPLSVKRI